MIPSVYQLLSKVSHGSLTTTPTATDHSTDLTNTPTSISSSATTSSTSTVVSTLSTPSTTPSTTLSTSASVVQSHSNAGAIAGGVVGGLVFLAVIALVGLWFFMRRRRNMVQKDIFFDNRALVSGPSGSMSQTTKSMHGPSQSIYVSRLVFYLRTCNSPNITDL